MTEQNNLNTDKETNERAADIITAQPAMVQCGEKQYTLKPRTPHQLRAISKVVSGYSLDAATDLLNVIGMDNSPEKKKKADKLNNQALDYTVVMVQMLLDTEPTFDPKKPTIIKAEIERGMDMVQMRKVLSLAAEMHDVSDLISKTQRLRVI